MSNIVGLSDAGFNPRTHTGCDGGKPIILFALVSFNPRTHTGCDLIIETGHAFFFVSIHAPTRGATAMQDNCTENDKFQSTHPHGVRHREKKLTPSVVEFQSTHPHGVRQEQVDYFFEKHGFQSTHPHGVRHHIIKIKIIIRRFQSTHPHGVRP